VYYAVSLPKDTAGNETTFTATSNEFFRLRNQPHLRGHKYVTNKQRCSNNGRNNFFSNRIVNSWNNLPSSTTDFTSFRKLDKSLNTQGGDVTLSMAAIQSPFYPQDGGENQPV